MWGVSSFVLIIKMTQQLSYRKTTQHLGKNIKNNPIKWPKMLNPAFGLKKNNPAFFLVCMHSYTDKYMHNMNTRIFYSKWKLCHHLLILMLSHTSNPNLLKLKCDCLMWDPMRFILIHMVELPLTIVDMLCMCVDKCLCVNKIINKICSSYKATISLNGLINMD